jgi:hypothetical protein
VRGLLRDTIRASGEDLRSHRWLHLAGTCDGFRRASHRDIVLHCASVSMASTRAARLRDLLQAVTTTELGAAADDA